MSKSKSKSWWAVILEGNINRAGSSYRSVAKATGTSAAAVSRWFAGDAPKSAERQLAIIGELKQLRCDDGAIAGMIEHTLDAGGKAAECMAKLVEAGKVAPATEQNRMSIKGASDMHEVISVKAQRHFGLKRDPFGGLTCAGDCYVWPELRELEEHLFESINGTNSMIVIIGPTGVGKTTLMQRLTERLKSELSFKILKPSMLNMAKLTERAIQRMVLDAAGITKGVCPGDLQQCASKTEKALSILNENHRCLLWVDQAEDLTDEGLILMKRLSEMTEGWRQLVRVVMTGQPAIREHFDSEANRQFVIRSEINEMPAINNAWSYIEFRFRRAGMSRDQLTKMFPKETRDALNAKVELLAMVSTPTPRAVENLTAKAINWCAQYEESTVTVEGVEHVQDAVRRRRSK